MPAVSLLDRLADLTDPRDRKGTQYPLVPLLALALVAITREHWGIENGLRHTRDETFREDRCRVRRGNAARVLASLRNVAVGLPRNTDQPSVPAATREMAAFPDRAHDPLKAPPPISE